jgi:hypothetical protein
MRIALMVEGQIKFGGYLFPFISEYFVFCLLDLSETVKIKVHLTVLLLFFEWV